MKKTAKIVLIAMVIMMSFFVSGCQKKENFVKVNGDTIVMTVSSKVMEITDKTTLLDYMTKLKEMKQIDFIVEKNMVTSINSRVADSAKKEFWASYTNDKAFSNSDWGTFDYENVTYASSTKGANEVIIKVDMTYIWTIKTF